MACCYGHYGQSIFDHHQYCTRCFKIKAKIEYGENNNRTLSDWGNIYEWHKICKACIYKKWLGEMNKRGEWKKRVKLILKLMYIMIDITIKTLSGYNFNIRLNNLYVDNVKNESITLLKCKPWWRL